MITTIILQIILLVLFLKYLWMQRKYYVLSWKFPSFLGLPFIGMAYLCKGTADVIYIADDFLKNIKSQLSVIWIGPIALLTTRDPDLLRRILTSSTCLNKLNLYNIAKDYVGNGLIVANDIHWSKHRKLLTPLFQLSNLKKNMLIFNKESEILAEILGAYKEQQQHELVDILKHIRICVLDVTFQTITGESMNFQKDQNGEMIKSLQLISNNISDRAMNPFYYVDFIFQFTRMHKILKTSRDYIEKYLYRIINSRWKLNEKSNIPSVITYTDEEMDDDDNTINDNSNKNLIDHTVKLFLCGKFQMNEVIDESIMFFIAAYETTTITTYMAIMCLAMFPEYQKKLYNELKSIFPNKNDFNVNFDDLQKLDYLEMIINETMRLFAPVPFIGRELSDDYKFSENIQLPKGGQILIDVFNMQRDEKFWGENAKKFDPNHFSAENIKNIHPFAFIPFAKGGRMCLGLKYAMFSMKVMLAKLLRKYEFRTDDRFEDLHFVFNLTISFKKFPQFRLYERID